MPDNYQTEYYNSYLAKISSKPDLTLQEKEELL